MQKEPASQSYPLTGMDVFSRECPDLKSFKRSLLTRKFSQAGSGELDKMVIRSLQTVGIQVSAYHELNLAERQVLLVFERACHDAGLDRSQADEIGLSMVVHFPDENTSEPWSFKQKPPELSPERIIKSTHQPGILMDIRIVHESSNNALEYTLSLFQELACTHVALVSFFPYSNPCSDNTALNLSTGLGCVIISKQNSHGIPYANLVCEQSQGLNGFGYEHMDFTMTGADLSSQPSLDTGKSWTRTNTHYQEKGVGVVTLPDVEFQVEVLDKHLQYPNFPHFQSAPVVRLIQSSLSLNNQTLFPDPEINLSTDHVGEVEIQASIRPWFPLPYAEKRECIFSLQNDGTLVHLEKEFEISQHPEQPFLNFGFYLLPIQFGDLQQGMLKLDEISKEITDCHDLAAYIHSSLTEFKTNQDNGYTLVLLGSTKQDLLGELERARQSLPKSFDDNRDWQTPSGSYFTPVPLGPKEKIAFVYPGAFGTYIGMGSEVFYLFPHLYDTLLELTTDSGNAINETEIFPERLTKEQKEYLQNVLNDNPTQMISSGVCFSHLFTVIMRDLLKVKPDVAFGYSLGENSMMFAMGIWTQADAMRTSLEASSIFHSRVSGAQNAIREFWGIPTESSSTKHESIWANYVLMAPYDKVKDAVKNEQRVYITHINAPRQVVIGGEKAACLRVIETLQCMHLQAPYHHAIHCEPVVSEFDAFMNLHDWPVENQPDIPIYTAADYAALPYDSKYIAKSFAKMLTNPIDFPRLVNLAYQDGARIFIELGAGSNCSKWIEGTLKGKPHIAMSINQNNIDDHVSILRLIARLVSHQIPVDLTPLAR